MIMYKYLPTTTACLNYCIFKIVLPIHICQTRSEINVRKSLINFSSCIGKMSHEQISEGMRVNLDKQPKCCCLPDLSLESEL